MWGVGIGCWLWRCFEGGEGGGRGVLSSGWRWGGGVGVCRSSEIYVQYFVNQIVPETSHEYFVGSQAPKIKSSETRRFQNLKTGA